MFMYIDRLTTLYETVLSCQSLSLAHFKEASGYVGESYMTRIYGGPLRLRAAFMDSL